MHIKINITVLEPNSLLHILWHKTSLRKQHTHLELLWILIYTIMIKNKHKLGNKTYTRDKIMVNSLVVHFSITRQQLEVGLKHKYILSYKIHLGKI
jgi:hypothetical protein